MKITFYLIFALITLQISAYGKNTTPKNTRFRNNVASIIRIADMPSGFDSLKHYDLGEGKWTCKQELDGFLPTVILDVLDPADRLLVKAVSIKPIANTNIRMLILRGLPGYTMKDSDSDDSVIIDKTTQSRKVIFEKKNRFSHSMVTVVFNAHEYESITLLIESWQLF